MRFWALTLIWGCAEVEQSASCEEYVACIRAQDAVSGVETDLERFEADGDCWGNPEGAALCDRATRSTSRFLTRSSATGSRPTTSGKSLACSACDCGRSRAKSKNNIIIIIIEFLCRIRPRLARPLELPPLAPGRPPLSRL